jgi:hypothetical protein
VLQWLCTVKMNVIYKLGCDIKCVIIGESRFKISMFKHGVLFVSFLHSEQLGTVPIPPINDRHGAEWALCLDIVHSSWSTVPLLLALAIPLYSTYTCIPLNVDKKWMRKSICQQFRSASLGIYCIPGVSSVSSCWTGHLFHLWSACGSYSYKPSLGFMIGMCVIR